MSRGIFLLLATILLFSCGNSDKERNNAENETQAIREGEIIQIEAPFTDSVFAEKGAEELLQELDICGESEDFLFSPCSAKLFNFRPFRSDKPIKDAFILEIKGGVRLKGEADPFPVRRVLVFERENGKLVRTNGFVGELIAFESSGNVVENLIIAFYDANEDVIFHCVFKWEDESYAFKEVMAIDYGPGPKAVKAGKKEEVSKEIYQFLREKSRLF